MNFINEENSIVATTNQPSGVITNFGASFMFKGQSRSFSLKDDVTYIAVIPKTKLTGDVTYTSLASYISGDNNIAWLDVANNENTYINTVDGSVSTTISSGTNDYITINLDNKNIKLSEGITSNFILVSALNDKTIDNYTTSYIISHADEDTVDPMNGDAEKYNDNDTAINKDDNIDTSYNGETQNSDAPLTENKTYYDVSSNNENFVQKVYAKKGSTSYLIYSRDEEDNVETLDGAIGSSTEYQIYAYVDPNYGHGFRSNTISFKYQNGTDQDQYAYLNIRQNGSNTHLFAFDSFKCSNASVDIMNGTTANLGTNWFLDYYALGKINNSISDYSKFKLNVNVKYKARATDLNDAEINENIDYLNGSTTSGVLIYGATIFRGNREEYIKDYNNNSADTFSTILTDLNDYATSAGDAFLRLKVQLPTEWPNAQADTAEYTLTFLNNEEELNRVKMTVNLINSGIIVFTQHCYKQANLAVGAAPSAGKSNYITMYAGTGVTNIEATIDTNK